MRVKISANPPLPAVRAWFPLHGHTLSTSTISSFKSLLCTSLPDFCGISPSSLRLSIDGFELLDHSELTVVRDGDLVSVDVRNVPPENVTRDRLKQAVVPLQSASHATPAPLEPTGPHKRKRRASTPSSPSSGSESDTEGSTTTESESETSDSDSGSDSDDSTRNVDANERAQATPSVQETPRVEHPSAFVPPGYGKPQTRARNLRRRLKRMHTREAAKASTGGPVSGANAVEAVVQAPDASPMLMSLSLRNKNKAKNFKSLMNRSLPAKIIFGDQGSVQTPALPRLVPPSSRALLPRNLFVTSVDVEAGKKQCRIESGDGDVTLDDGVNPERGSEVDIDRLERGANEVWDSLERLTREKQLAVGTLVGYKALGIDAVTCTPGHVLTVGRVVSCDQGGVVVRALRAVSFKWSDETEAETEHPWEEIEGGDWRLL